MTVLGEFGNLYLHSIADDTSGLKDALAARPEGSKELVEPRVYFPAGLRAPRMSLDALIGKDTIDLGYSTTTTGDVSESFGGKRLVNVKDLDLQNKRVFITISDQGFLGAETSITDLEVRWSGDRMEITALRVKVLKVSEWQLTDRAGHFGTQKVVRTSSNVSAMMG